MKKEQIYNLPNFLSLYRLVTFPFLLWLIYIENSKLFAILLCINLITDILDGLIARLFKLQTEFGAKLDSLADYGTYILAFIGIYEFKAKEIGHYIVYLWIFAGLILIYNVIAQLKFKKFPSLHLYSTKIGGYIQGTFFFCLFMFNFYPILFYIAMFIGYYSSIEEIIILFKLKRMRSNAKGLYWVIKNPDK